MTPFDTFLPVTRVRAVLDLSWSAGKRFNSPDRRPFHAVSVRLRGSARLIHGDTVTRVGRGDVIYLPRGYDYVLDSADDEQILCFHFDLDERALPDASLLTAGVFTPADPSRYVDLFQRLLKTWNEKKPGYEYASAAQVNGILESIAGERHTLGRSSASELLDGALLYANTHFASPELSVAEIARAAAVSEVWLRRLFRAGLGVSPHEYVARLRTDHAAALLKSGWYTVEETAARCGFGNAKNFSTFFRKRVGVSPSALMRAGARGGPETAGRFPDPGSDQENGGQET